MQNSGVWIKVGAWGVMLAILFGAFGAHGLKGHLSDYEMSVFEKANYYQLTQSLGLLILVVLAKVDLLRRTSALRSLRLLALGIVIFSGSLYLLALTGIRIFGAITPIGGICLILAWAVVALGVGTTPQKETLS